MVTCFCSSAEFGWNHWLEFDSCLKNASVVEKMFQMVSFALREAWNATFNIFVFLLVLKGGMRG